MKAWIIDHIADLNKTENPLSLQDVTVPTPETGQVLIRVSVCGVCHTELDEIEGRTPPPRFPVIPGHQVVGTIVEQHAPESKLRPGDRVGAGWIYDACGRCRFCKSGLENLCADFRATGRDANGEYAEFMVAPASSVCKLPDQIPDIEAAPLLCAGAIGYRSLNLANISDGKVLGLTGFGASGHLVLKMARLKYPKSTVCVFARSPKERDFAIALGAAWAGDTGDTAPQPCDAIIDTTPVWTPVLEALRNLSPGGRLVINAIRKEPGDQSVLQKLDYSNHLWMEKEIKSVANITRQDIIDFLVLAAELKLKPQVEMIPFQNANRALVDLKQGRIRGAKVLQIASG